MCQNNDPSAEDGFHAREKGMAMLIASIVTGALVSYTAPGTSDVQCLEVRLLTSDWGQTPMAWLTVVADPRRVVHAPLEALLPGCPAAVGEAPPIHPADAATARR
jgi:hypothetical protein